MCPKRRAIVRERLSSRQRAKEDEEKAEKDKISKREAKERQKFERSEKEKLEKMREREERRKKKQLAKLMQRDNVDLNGKVAEERQKLLETQKKLQAMRLIEELFQRIEIPAQRRAQPRLGALRGRLAVQPLGLGAAAVLRAPGAGAAPVRRAAEGRPPRQPRVLLLRLHCGLQPAGERCRLYALRQEDISLIVNNSDFEDDSKFFNV